MRIRIKNQGKNWFLLLMLWRSIGPPMEGTSFRDMTMRQAYFVIWWPFVSVKHLFTVIFSSCLLEWFVDYWLTRWLTVTLDHNFVTRNVNHQEQITWSSIFGIWFLKAKLVISMVSFHFQVKVVKILSILSSFSTECFPAGSYILDFADDFAYTDPVSSEIS